MPFRRNAFGEHIAQPGTHFLELDSLFFGAYDRPPQFYGAFISLERDDVFLFGGELLDNGYVSDGVGGAYCDSDEPRNLQFDGFETLADAKAWVVSMGISERYITVES